MKTSIGGVIVGALAMVLVPGIAVALPVTGCDSSFGGTCNLVENADPSAEPVVIASGGIDGDQFFVLLEPGTSLVGNAKFDTNNWSDVVHIDEDHIGQTANDPFQIELFSDPNLFAEFTAAQIIAGIEFPTVYVVEGNRPDLEGNPTELHGCCNGTTIFAYSDVAEVPEPATLTILGAALAGFGLMRRRRNRTA